MKLHLLFFFIAAVLLTNCTTVRSTSSGTDNDAYIVLVSSNVEAYPSPLKVSIGDDLQFNASVVDERKRVPQNAILSFPAGQYLVVVKQGDRVLYSQTIRLDIQQTRRITLP
jgi:hypothetical protein